MPPSLLEPKHVRCRTSREISLPKLIVAWAMLLVVPGLLLGLAPIVFVEWLTIVTDKLASLGDRRFGRC